MITLNTYTIGQTIPRVNTETGLSFTLSQIIKAYTDFPLPGTILSPGTARDRVTKPGAQRSTWPTLQ